jgi:hypothetical protein
MGERLRKARERFRVRQRGKWQRRAIQGREGGRYRRERGETK